MFRSGLGLLAVLLAAYSYIPYCCDIARGKTKPHAFSWLIWGTMTVIGFAAQVTGGGGAGTWVTGFTAVICLGIFVIALFRGEKHITTLDWLCLGGAGLAIVLWALTNGPLLSVILITIIDGLGVVPTLRKSYARPDQETLITYAISGTKFVVSIAALKTFSLVTVLYPLSLVFSNGAIVAMLTVRRRVLRDAALRGLAGRPLR